MLSRFGTQGQWKRRHPSSWLLTFGARFTPRRLFFFPQRDNCVKVFPLPSSPATRQQTRGADEIYAGKKDLLLRKACRDLGLSPVATLLDRLLSQGGERKPSENVCVFDTTPLSRSEPPVRGELDGQVQFVLAFGNHSSPRFFRFSP